MRSSRRLRILVGLCAVPVVLVLSLFIIDFGEVLRGPILARLSSSAAELGLKVEVGALHLILLPRARLSATDIRLSVEGERGPPLLRVAALEAAAAAWPLLQGKAQVEDLALRAPALHVSRSAAGRLSVQPVLDRLAQRPRKDLDQEALDRLRRVALLKAAISDGSARFEEQESGRSFAVEHIQIQATDLAIGSAPKVKIQAAVQSETRNLEVDVALLLIPGTLPAIQAAAAQVPVWPLRQVHARLSEVSIDPLLSLLPAVYGLRLAKAALHADADGELDLASGSARLRVNAGLRGAQIAAGAALGRKEDLTLQAEGELGLVQGTARITTLAVGLGAMRATGALALSGLPGAPKVERLSLQGSGLTLEGLLSLLPPGTRPKDEVLRGPLKVRAEQEKDEARLHLDASAATLHTADLDKAAGSALVISLVGRLRPSLRGDLQIDLGASRLRGVSFKGQIINPLLGRLFEVMKQRQPPAPRDTEIERLRARVALRGGRLHLREDAPLRLSTREAAARLTGSIGLSGGLLLDGQIDIEPAAIQAATKGRLRPQRAVPVKVRITGHKDAPRIEFLDLQRTLAALRPEPEGRPLRRKGPPPPGGKLRERLRDRLRR